LDRGLKRAIKNSFATSNKTLAELSSFQCEKFLVDDEISSRGFKLDNNEVICYLAGY
jgi:hypothetical protein